MINQRSIIVIFVFCITAFLLDSAAAVQYEVTDLGTLGGQYSTARAINASGQVVGNSNTTLPYGNAFLWDNGVMINLGTLGGVDSYAKDINNEGQIIGHSSNGTIHDPFVWFDGVMSSPGSFGAAGTYVIGNNNLGHYVGSFDNGVTTEGFLTNIPETYIPLGTFGWNNSVAYAINDAGKIVGKMYDDNNNSHAFLWDNGTFTDLGVLGRNYSVALSINNTDQVVGFSTTGSGHRHAFFWDAGSMTNLGTLTGIYGHSYANAINDIGQIAGQSWNAESIYHAVIWEDGEIYDLNTFIDSESGWILNRAYDINNLGQIVGEGTINSETHAFLLTPYTIRISDVTPMYYSSLQAAYDDAIDGDIIQSQVAVLDEDLDIDFSKSVALEGGYDGDYSVQSGYTILNGIIDITKGSIEIGSFILQQY